MAKTSSTGVETTMDGDRGSGMGVPGTMLADISTGAETTMDVDVGSGIGVPGTMLEDISCSAASMDVNA